MKFIKHIHKYTFRNSLPTASFQNFNIILTNVWACSGILLFLHLISIFKIFNTGSGVGKLKIT